MLAPDLAVRLTTGPGESVDVGRLVERDRRMLFQFEPSWIASGLELSPLHLRLQSGLIEYSHPAFGPLPGLFDDSLPDGWGLLLMDRHFRQHGMNPRTLSPLHRLAWLGTRTMGALTYHPSSRADASESAHFDLAQVAEAARAVYSGATAEVLPQLLRAGGSPGGARPKALVGFNPRADELFSGEEDLPESFEHWLVKFTGTGDDRDAGPIELAYSTMARFAGLDVPATRLFETSAGDRFFGIQRFDRSPGNRRVHVHTFGNLIESNFRVPSCDYRDLLRATSLITRNHQEVLRAFRRMVFNVCAHNRDDHVKNFAFLFDHQSGTWALSPAYDLTFSSGPGGEHSMTVEGQGRQPDLNSMLTLAERFSIERADAQAIFDGVNAAISQWPHFAAAAGVPKAAQVEVASRHVLARG